MIGNPATKSCRIKGKSNQREVCEHFTRVRTEIKQQQLHPNMPQTGQLLLKGLCRRRSHLNSKESDSYQRFFDNMEATQRAGVFALQDNISLYLLPLSKNTRQFFKSMDLDQSEFEHLEQQSL